VSRTAALVKGGIFDFLLNGMCRAGLNSLKAVSTAVLQLLSLLLNNLPQPWDHFLLRVVILGAGALLLEAAACWEPGGGAGATATPVVVMLTVGT